MIEPSKLRWMAFTREELDELAVGLMAAEHEGQSSDTDLSDDLLGQIQNEETRRDATQAAHRA